MRRMLLLAVGVAAAAAAALISALLFRSPAFQKWLNPPVAYLPDDADIQSMRATLYESEFGSRAIPEFAVPPAHIPRILFWFRPSKYVAHPPIFLNHDVMGKLIVTTQQGKTTEITFYWSGQNPPVFTVDGEDFYWGGGTTEDHGRGVDGGIMAGKAVEAAYAESADKRQ
jgi:hypothetical protein